MTEPRSLTPASTSYWSRPEASLDPVMFTGDRRIRPEVRTGLLRKLYGFWSRRYRNAERWSTLWLAGSGASYQWAAARDPGDLDLLIGVDYPAFRASNPGYHWLSDAEISAHLNDEFKELNAETASYPIGGRRFEVTWFSNPHATDIQTINPYAAYNLSDNSWTVTPDPSLTPPKSPLLDQKAHGDVELASSLLDRYNAAHAALSVEANPGRQLNLAQELKHVLDAGSKLFDEIHEQRHLAFDEDGGGYQDWHNYRWQAGKASGVIPLLRDMKAERGSLYGEAPVKADRLLIEAALYRRNR